MARQFTTGSSTWLSYTTSAPVTAVPLTIAGWVKVTADVFNSVVSIGVNANNNNRFSLGVSDAANGATVRAQARSSINGIATSTASYSVDMWHHMAAVFYAHNSRAAFLDGGNKGTETTSVTPLAGLIDSIYIGNNMGLSSAGLSGHMGEIGVWNVALTDGEIASLAGGLSPLMVRPGNLVFYCPILGISDPEPDLSGNGRAMAVNNATTIVDHPRVGPRFGFDTGQTYAVVATTTSTSTTTTTSTSSSTTTTTTTTSTSTSTSTSTTTTPGGMDIQTVLEMGDDGFRSVTFDGTYASSEIAIDTAKYDGTVTYEFEALIYNDEASASRSVYIVDSGDNVLGTLTASAQDGVSRGKRFRTTFTPNAGSDTYRVKLEATTSNGLLRTFATRVIITQVGATKTRIQIPLIQKGYVDASTGTALYGFSDGSNYGQGGSPQYHSLYNKVSSRFADLIASNPWTFEAIISGAAGQTVSASLFNATDNTQVADSEVSLASSASVTRVAAAFANNATNFDDNDDFEVRVKGGASGASCNIYAARLYVELENLSAAEVYFRTMKSDTGVIQGMTDLVAQRVLYDSTKFSNPVLFHEGTAWETTAGTVALQLFDDGTDDEGTVAGGSGVGDLNFSGSRSVVRSSSISITSGDRVVTTTNAGSTGTLSVSDGLLVVATSAEITTSTSTSTTTTTSTSTSTSTTTTSTSTSTTTTTSTSTSTSTTTTSTSTSTTTTTSTSSSTSTSTTTTSTSTSTTTTTSTSTSTSTSTTTTSTSTSTTTTTSTSTSTSTSTTTTSTSTSTTTTTSTSTSSSTSTTTTSTSTSTTTTTSTSTSSSTSTTTTSTSTSTTTTSTSTSTTTTTSTSTSTTTTTTSTSTSTSTTTTSTSTSTTTTTSTSTSTSTTTTSTSTSTTTTTSTSTSTSSTTTTTSTSTSTTTSTSTSISDTTTSTSTSSTTTTTSTSTTTTTSTSTSTTTTSTSTSTSTTTTSTSTSTTTTTSTSSSTSTSTTTTSTSTSTTTSTSSSTSTSTSTTITTTSTSTTTSSSTSTSTTITTTSTSTTTTTSTSTSTTITTTSTSSTTSSSTSTSTSITTLTTTSTSTSTTTSTTTTVAAYPEVAQFGKDKRAPILDVIR